MKNITKFIILSAFVVLSCFALLPADRTQAAPVAVEASPAAFASAYGTYCSRCHGGDGRANTAKGRELDADDLTTSKVQNMSSSRLSSIIKHGKGDMPGFPKLSAAQISSIIKSVKAF